MLRNSSGQSLPDAMIALGLLSMTIATVISLNATAYRSTFTANLQSDITSLYSEIAAAISTEPTCRVLLGGSSQATGHPDVTPQRYVVGKTNFILYRSTSSFQGGTPAPAPSSQPPTLIDPSDSELKKYGKWEVTSVSLTPLAGTPLSPTGPKPFQLNIQMQPPSMPNKSRSLRFYLSILLDGSDDMLSCSSLTYSSSPEIFPICADHEALTSWDHVKVQCKPYRCPSGTPTYDARGDLVCP